MNQSQQETLLDTLDIDHPAVCSIVRAYTNKEISKKVAHKRCCLKHPSFAHAFNISGITYTNNNSYQRAFGRKLKQLSKMIPPQQPPTSAAASTAANNNTQGAVPAAASVQTTAALPQDKQQFLVSLKAKLSNDNVFAEQFYSEMTKLKDSRHSKPGWEGEVHRNLGIPGAFNRTDLIVILNESYDHCGTVRSTTTRTMAQPSLKAPPGPSASSTNDPIAFASTAGRTETMAQPSLKVPPAASSNNPPAATTNEIAGSIRPSASSTTNNLDKTVATDKTDAQSSEEEEEELQGPFMKLVKDYPEVARNLDDERWEVIKQSNQKLVKAAEKSKQEYLQKTATDNQAVEVRLERQDSNLLSRDKRLEAHLTDGMAIAFLSPSGSKRSRPLMSSPVEEEEEEDDGNQKRVRTRYGFNQSSGAGEFNMGTASGGTTATPVVRRKIMRAKRPKSASKSVPAGLKAPPPAAAAAAPQDENVAPFPQDENAAPPRHSEEEVKRAVAEYLTIKGRVKQWNDQRESLGVAAATEQATRLLEELDGVSPALKQDVAITNDKKNVVQWIQEQCPDNSTVDPASLRPRVGEGAYSQQGQQQGPQQAFDDLESDDDL